MTDIKDNESSVVSAEKAWIWKTDWCKDNGLNPRSRDSWEKAQAAYEESLRPTECLPTSYIPISKPRPPFQVNKEPIKIGEQEDIMSFNVGESNYSTKKIQPWHIWEEYNLNPWDADIVKRVLRTKKQPGKTLVKSRIEDYQKIIHNCQYRIKKLEESNTLDKKKR